MNSTADGSSHDITLVNLCLKSSSSDTTNSTLSVVGAGTAAAAQRVTTASDSPDVSALTTVNSNLAQLHTDMTAATPAGSNTIGGVKLIDTGGTNVGGIDSDGSVKVRAPINIRVTSAQTVTASSAYSAANAVGGKITFSSATRVAAQGGIIQSAVLRDKAGQIVNYDLFLFDADPTSTTVTDKSAVAINTADLAKVIGVVTLSGASLGAASTMGVITANGLGLAFKLTSGSTMYGILVTRGAPTYASTSDVSVDLVIIPD